MNNNFYYTSYFDFLLIDFASLSNLEVLDLSYNSFSGIVPSSIRLMSSLKSLSLAGNYLNGSLPNQSTYIEITGFSVFFFNILFVLYDNEVMHVY